MPLTEAVSCREAPVETETEVAVEALARATATEGSAGETETEVTEEKRRGTGVATHPEDSFEGNHDAARPAADRPV